MPRGRKPGSQNKILTDKPTISDGKITNIVDKSKPEPKHEGWWNERAADNDIKILLTLMGATNVSVFKREAVEPNYHGQGMAVCFYRFGRVQYLACSVFPSTGQNLRQIFLSLKSLYTIKSQGTTYTGLSTLSGTAMVPDGYLDSIKTHLLPPPTPEP